MKKGNIIYAVVILLASLILFPTITYVINSLLDGKISYGEFKENLTVQYFLSLIFNKEVFLSYIRFNPINVGFWGVTGVGIILIMMKSFTTKEKETFEQVEKYGSHGSAKFMGVKEIREKFYHKEPGWFLGSISEDGSFDLNTDFAVHRLNNPKQLNLQVNVVGPPGSNKTTGLLYPNIFYIADIYKNLNEKADIIVTDPKGEILEQTGNYLKEHNYDIRVIDFLHLKYGDAVNPLSYIEDQKDIMKVASGFVSAAGMKNAKSQNADPIWEQGETLLLAALIAFVLEVYEKEDHRFEKVSEILGSPVMRDYDKAAMLFKQHGVTGYGEELWNKFLNLEDKLRSGVVGGLSIKMALFSLDSVKQITGGNTIDFNLLGNRKEKPIVLFIQMPDEDRTFAPIINTMISMMFKTMYGTARLYSNRLPNPVYMILEEIANIGRIPDLLELLGTMRGRRIYPMMIWQDLVQMKTMFGDGWDGVIAKCDTQVYLGVNDQTTAEYVSKKLGKTTIRTQGQSSKDEGLMSSGKSISESYNQRPLLFPDEVERFDNKKLIVIQRSNDPIILNKTQYKYWENPITEPLKVNQLPLLSRFENETNESINELFKEEVSFEPPSTILPITEDGEILESIEAEQSVEIPGAEYIEEDIVVDVEPTIFDEEEVTFTSESELDSEDPFSIDVEDEISEDDVFDFEEKTNETVDFHFPSNPIK